MRLLSLKKFTVKMVCIKGCIPDRSAGTRELSLSPISCLPPQSLSNKGQKIIVNNTLNFKHMLFIEYFPFASGTCDPWVRSLMLCSSHTVHSKTKITETDFFSRLEQNIVEFATCVDVRRFFLCGSLKNCVNVKLII